MVAFDAEDTVEFIELSQFSDHEAVEPRVDGVPVLKLPAQEAVAFMEGKAPFDPDDEELGFTFMFPSLQLCLWRPSDDEETVGGKTFATIAVARPGYWS